MNWFENICSLIDDSWFWVICDDIAKNDIVKQYYISQALSATEGRMAVAQAMVEPIRRALEYQSIGRRLFTVDELPQGANVSYIGQL